MNHTLTLPLRLQVAALGEGLLVGEPIECQHFALRLIEIAGYGQRKMSDRGLGPVELVTGLSDRWRARHGESALRALAMGWANLDTDMRRLAVALGRTRWIAVVKDLAGDAEYSVRKRALGIAMDTGDPGFGVMVCSMLGDEHQQVRLAADKTLIGLVLGMFGHLDRGMLGEDYANIRDRAITPMLGDQAMLELERCAMLSAIADAAWSFADHRCRSPLLASLLLMDRQGGSRMERRAFEKMRRLLSERNHPSHMPMRTVLRTTPAPVLRERALRWLVIDPIAGVASARLGVAESIEEHRAVLDQMHLCVRPARAQGLKKVRVGTTQVNGVVALEDNAPVLSSEGFGQLDSGSKRGYIRWLTGLAMEPSVRRGELERVMADTDPMVRMHGCCVADSLDVLDYMYDGNESIARHAAMRWSSVGSVGPGVGSPSWERRLQTARLNGRSGSEQVRRIADDEVSRLSMEMPERASSRLQARRLYASDPARFVREIRAMLQQPARRGQALGMISAMELEDRFEMDLVSLSQEHGLDGRVRASLVRALSEITSDGARDAVLRCLESDDQRVVANAIESVHTPIGVLVEYKGDTHHRVRSSAIRRMLLAQSELESTNRVAEVAAEDLGAMLHDSRVNHRLAGVWAAQRVLEPNMRRSMKSRTGGHWRDLVMTLNEMTIHETDDGVRGRADQCVHRMLVSQRAREMQTMMTEGA